MSADPMGENASSAGLCSIEALKTSIVQSTVRLDATALEPTADLFIENFVLPSAAPASILLDDRALLDISPEAMTTALLAISAKFDSLEDEDATAFFTVEYKGLWPARIGHLVGLIIARDVAPTMPLGEFCSLPLGRMRQLYRDGLNRLIGKSKTSASSL